MARTPDISLLGTHNPSLSGALDCKNLLYFASAGIGEPRKFPVNEFGRMTVTLPEELVRAAHLSEGELKVELAIVLFQQDRVTLGQAAQLAQVSQLEFQRTLATRRQSGSPPDVEPDRCDPS